MYDFERCFKIEQMKRGYSFCLIQQFIGLFDVGLMSGLTRG